MKVSALATVLKSNNTPYFNGDISLVVSIFAKLLPNYFYQSDSIQRLLILVNLEGQTERICVI